MNFQSPIRVVFFDELSCVSFQVQTHNKYRKKRICFDGNIFAKNVMKGSNKYCQPFVYKLRFLMNFLAPWGAERNIYISFNCLRLA